MKRRFTTVVACALALGAAPAAHAASTTCPPAGTDHLGYSAQLGSNTVSVIDLDAQRSIDQITGFNYPFNAEVSPDGRRLYVDNSPIGQNDKDYFQILDLCSRQPVKTIQTGGPAFSSITNDGRYVYNVPPGGPIRRFDTGDDRETSIPTDDPDVFYAVSTDGKVVWLEDANLADTNHAGYAYAIDGETGNVISPKVQIGFEPVVAQMTPDGSKLVTFNLGSSVSIVDTKT
ncbi:MAG: hypothetical protein QOF76_4581, partial [Solirubrobacteraceae bacterium]|nr:hypothetical protein [Solirubrobacteraceae bacterium]